ncbi:MAG: LTA synthase family protein [Clostridia bacterium]|nr:LTA synthase family protein [Clostridia bacterium]
MQKLKNLFQNIAKQINLIFDDKGIFNLPRFVILIFILSLWTIVFQMVAQNFNIMQLYPPILLFNIIPVFLVICLLYFITGKIAISYVVTNILLGILLVINHYKIKFRDEPLRASDFSLGNEATNIIQNYSIKPDIIIVVMIIFIVVSFWFVLKKIKNKRPNFILSLTGIIITSVIAITCNQTIYANTKTYDKLLSSLGIFHESTIVSCKGLIYTLLNDAHTTKYQPPEGYSREKVDELLGSYQTPEYTGKMPNVIAVMCEAYADIQDWENIKFTGDSPYQYINYMKRRGCYGSIVVPGFAGATATTEFEFLTGNNTSAISPTMPTAYKTHINGNVNSIVRYFKDMGYEAVSMHPGYPWFYNRQNVYLRMGFDSFMSKDDLEGDVPNINTYALDTVASDMIIKDYERHLREAPDKGYFSFTVTIQNHGPYDDDELRYETEYVSKDCGLTDEEYYIINNYLGGIKAANDFIKVIYKYINTLDEPTVFIIFGDHLPYLDAEEKIYEKLGLDIASNSFDAYINRYSTDYFIIGNDAYTDKNKPSVRGKQKLISANYLSLKLFQYMNMEFPPFHSFLYDMMQYAPILSKQHNGTGEGFEEQLPEEFNEIYKNYKILQYYNLKEYDLHQKGENQ